MSRLSSFVFGMLLGAGLCFGALKYHVLRTNEGYQFVPKLTASFSDTYVDVRSFKADDWSRHKPLVTAIVQAGKGSLLGEGEVNALREEANHVLDRLGFHPQQG